MSNEDEDWGDLDELVEASTNALNNHVIGSPVFFQDRLPPIKDLTGFHNLRIFRQLTLSRTKRA